jgi:hypothetical protein
MPPSDRVPRTPARGLLSSALASVMQLDWQSSGLRKVGFFVNVPSFLPAPNGLRRLPEPDFAAHPTASNNNGRPSATTGNLALVAFEGSIPSTVEIEPVVGSTQQILRPLMARGHAARCARVGSNSAPRAALLWVIRVRRPELDTGNNGGAPLLIAAGAR